ncbi:MAG: hypothetical protein WD492_11850 [Alkalispirochaeta sp.]
MLSEATQGWATCPITEAGFLRVSMNPTVVGREIRFSDALDSGISTLIPWEYADRIQLIHP